jgi:predicted secreted protein
VTVDSFLPSTVTVEECPEPTGELLDARCEGDNVLVDVEGSNLSANTDLLVQAQTNQGTLTTTVTTDGDGNIDTTATLTPGSGEVVTEIKLFAGPDTSAGSLDVVTNLELDCDFPSQNVLAVSNKCEQLTVTNPSENDANVDFRIRNDTGLVQTVDDVAPDESRTVENLSGGEYTVDARFVKNDQFNSDNVTVNGESESTVTVKECPEPTGDLLNARCEGGKILVDVEGSNLSANTELLVQATTNQGTLTTTVTTDGDGNIDTTATLTPGFGEVVTEIELFAGSDTSAGSLDVVTNLELDCNPTQDTTAVSKECEQLTMTNPSENDADVDFRIRNDTGLVQTVDDVAPDESRTVENLSGGEYTVDARFVKNDQFNSDNVTVNGESESTVTVKECPEPTGDLLNARCEGGKILVDVEGSNLSANTELLVQATTNQGTLTTTVTTDGDGNIDTTATLTPGFGEVVTEIELFAGPDTSAGSLDVVTDLELDCNPTQDTTAVSNKCGQLTVTNPGENDANVDFRIRNESGLVQTVKDIAPGKSRTVENLSGGEYTIDARFVQDDSFGSGAVTVDGKNESTVTVEECQESVKCPSSFSGFKIEAPPQTFEQSGVSGKVTPAQLTISNTNDFDIAVWFKTGAQDGMVVGPVIVEAGATDTVLEGPTQDISAIGIVCPNGPPDFPPFTKPDGASTESSGGPDGASTDTNSSGSSDGNVANNIEGSPDTSALPYSALISGLAGASLLVIKRRD